jgi:hypothetical protein
MSDQSPLDDSISAWTRADAIENIENLKGMRTLAWDEFNHSFRWLMASLLAINGGALLAMLDHSSLGLSHRVSSGCAFVFGIIMALLVAVFGQHSTIRSLPSLQKMIGYWMTVAVDGLRDEKIENDLDNELKASVKLGLGSRVSGWLSAIAFLIGIGISGHGLISFEDVSKNVGRDSTHTKLIK